MVSHLVFGGIKEGSVDGAEFVMGKVRGDKVRDKGMLIYVGFTLTKTGRPRRIFEQHSDKMQCTF